MEYKLVYGDTGGELAGLVNTAIAEGWEPIGGIALAEREVKEDGYREIDQLFVQAMILPGPDRN